MSKTKKKKIVREYRAMDWIPHEEYDGVLRGIDKKTGCEVYLIWQKYGHKPFDLIWAWRCHGPYVGHFKTLEGAKAAAQRGTHRCMVGVRNFKHIDEYAAQSIEEHSAELNADRQESISAQKERFAKYYAMSVQRKKEEVERRDN